MSLRNLYKPRPSDMIGENGVNQLVRHCRIGFVRPKMRVVTTGATKGSGLIQYFVVPIYPHWPYYEPHVGGFRAS